MRRIILAAVAAISLTAAGALFADRAEAAPLFDGLQGAAPSGNIANVQLLSLFGGHRYCWYPDGWNGPGWYSCGYRLRRGFGYGGPEGWQGHSAPRGGHSARAPIGRAVRGPNGHAFRGPGGHAPSGHAPSGHAPSGRK